MVVLIFGFIMFSCFSNYALWFDLLEQIASKVQSYYNRDFNDEKFSNVYSSKFSKDPFGDAMSNIENKSAQLKLAWAQYVEQVLKQEWCDSLSQKKIRSILYYFVPEFRVELARYLKQENGDYDTKKYDVGTGKIEKYCEEYYQCEKLSEWYYEGLRWNELAEMVTASTPLDPKSYCSEKFQNYYKNGKNNREILQQVEVAQIWADKYWNGTTDDSPYDIMSDLWVLAKLLYYGVEDPITPIVYNIPMFSNSKKNLEERKNTNSSSVGISLHGWNIDKTPEWNLLPGDRWYQDSDDWWEWVSLLWRSTNQDQILDMDGKSYSDIKWLPLSYDEDWYDDLVDWLNSLSLVNDDSNFYSSLCKEENEESDPEVLIKENTVIFEDNRDFSELSDQEYQEIIDYMIDAVNDYSRLPEEKEIEIEKNMWDINNIFDATSPTELEDLEDQIKNCWKSCEGLRVDQKASCMIKCACWEIKSPIFNPEETPWLWPIFLIRFCAVPAVSTKFSVGWKRIHSIEEWLNEIYWAVDKLSREWKLWKWTQQYEFLDSSTKKINIADTLAFSIDVDFVDITNKAATHSNQYEDKKLENFNEEALLVYGVSNPLNVPSAKNVYRVVWDWWDEAVSLLQPMVDLIEDSKAYRYSVNEESIGRWMDQQWALRTKVSEDFSDWIKYSEKLYTKKS